ncbi:hypothetical protein HPB47_015441, partial [Ixodes persulcatus]
CRCNRFQLMPTARECVCCLKVLEVAFKAGCLCITGHADVFGGILYPVVLQIVYQSCGQAPAWNPFALPFGQLFAQPSALSTTEPVAESA